MITIRVDTKGMTEAIKNLQGLARQIPFATAKALTDTAYDVRAEVQKQLPQKLDRPTRFTTNAPRVQKATKISLQAIVYLRDNGEFAPARLLLQQFAGGGRAPKKFEQLLRQSGYINADEFIMPGRAAALDRFGNVKRTLLAQILQAIKATPIKTSAKRKRAVVKGGIFWSDGKDGLPKGAWVRLGTNVRCLLFVTRAPRYQQRISLHQIAEPVVRARFPINFASALEQAMATAR